MSATFFENESNAILASNALYDPIQREEGYIRGYFAIGECRADLTKVAGANSFDQLAAQQIAKYTQLSDNTFVVGIYKWSYVGIQRCNNFIENVTYSLSYGKSADESKRKISQLRGQAFFMRAFYYADLVRIYGPVQFINKTVTAETLTASNRTADDDADGNKQIELIYKQIIQDLDSAVALLPTREQWGSVNLGRATKGAALAFLSKTYMYVASNDKIFVGDKSQYYQKAADAADAVLTMGEYELEKDYHRVFASNNENNKESLFEIQAANGEDADFRAEGNIRALDQSYRYLAMGAASTGTLGYGLNSPTFTYVNMFDVVDANGNQGYSVYGSDRKVSKKVDWDPRLDMIAKPEDSIWADLQGTKQWCRFYFEPWKWAIQEPFYGRKTELQWDERNGKGGQSSFRNWIYYRLAELILYRAEAALKLGDAATALKMTNMIRTRARNSKAIAYKVDGNHGVPVVDATKGVYPKDLTSVTMDDIIKERALELGTENVRFFDLVRTGYASTLLSKVEMKESIGSSVFGFTTTYKQYKPKDAYLPLPASVIVEGNGSVKQNTGY